MLTRRKDPGVYAFTALVDTSDEDAQGMVWAKSMGKEGIERLRKGLEVNTPLCF